MALIGLPFAKSSIYKSSSIQISSRSVVTIIIVSNARSLCITFSWLMSFRTRRTWIWCLSIWIRIWNKWSRTRLSCLCLPISNHGCSWRCVDWIIVIVALYFIGYVHHHQKEWMTNDWLTFVYRIWSRITCCWRMMVYWRLLILVWQEIGVIQDGKWLRK